jgi:hypothetical protein
MFHNRTALAGSGSIAFQRPRNHGLHSTRSSSDGARNKSYICRLPGTTLVRRRSQPSLRLHQSTTTATAANGSLPGALSPFAALQGNRPKQTDLFFLGVYLLFVYLSFSQLHHLSPNTTVRRIADARPGAGEADGSQLPAGYQLPPQAIIDIVDAPQEPSLSFSPDRRRVLSLHRGPPLPPISELARPELKLGGLRIDTELRARSRMGYYVGLSLADNSDDLVLPAPEARLRHIHGIPRNMWLNYVTWARDSAHIAFTLRSAGARSSACSWTGVQTPGMASRKASQCSSVLRVAWLHRSPGGPQGRRVLSRTRLVRWRCKAVLACLSLSLGWQPQGLPPVRAGGDGAPARGPLQLWVADAESGAARQLLDPAKFGLNVVFDECAACGPRAPRPAVPGHAHHAVCPVQVVAPVGGGAALSLLAFLSVRQVRLAGRRHNRGAGGAG